MNRKISVGKDHRPVVDLCRHMGQFRNPDDVGQRSVLDHGDELVHEGGDHVPQGLGQDDENHRVAGGEGPSRGPLPSGPGESPRFPPGRSGDI